MEEGGGAKRLCGLAGGKVELLPQAGSWTHVGC